MGFWHAIVLHAVSVPIDVIVLLVLCIWGSAVLNQDGSAECYKDDDCRPFLQQVHFMVILGYGYIFFSIIMKPILLSIFCFCMPGLQWLNQDEQEEKEW